jgi:hypothetical protein
MKKAQDFEPRALVNLNYELKTIYFLPKTVKV